MLEDIIRAMGDTEIAIGPAPEGGLMVCIADRQGIVYALGKGRSELEAICSLAADVDNRARKWLAIRRLVRVQHAARRETSAINRANRSAEFLAGKKGGQA
jgi:hypothetical protein